MNLSYLDISKVVLTWKNYILTILNGTLIYLYYD